MSEVEIRGWDEQGNGGCLTAMGLPTIVRLYRILIVQSTIQFSGICQSGMVSGDTERE
jgi:hypothetical protein